MSDCFRDCCCRENWSSNPNNCDASFCLNRMVEKVQLFNDLVKAVRCKDCIYFDHEHGAKSGDCGLLNAEVTFPPDGYCSYGEKKEGDEDG